MRVVTGNRSATRPTEVAFAVLVAAYCVVSNALAVAYVEPFSPDNLGPLALAYHDARTALPLLPLLVLALLFCRALRGIGRAALIVFVGAASANIVSSVLWGSGVPDYIVFRHIDVITNLSDILMIVSAAVVLGSMLRRSLWGR